MTGFSTPLPHSVRHRRLHRSQRGTPRTMGRCPRGELVQSPGSTKPAQAKNGVGRLPHEEAADAVTKKESLRPW